MKSAAPTIEKPGAAPAPRLGLWDAVSIIVGIVVGTAIFRSPAAVFANSPTAATALTLWVVGGVLSWCGAVCYAELATTYPRDGGDYVYLTRAFGRWCGFLFCWAQLTTVLTGNIAIMAYAFADYAKRLLNATASDELWLTILPIVILSALNAIGIVAGKFTQNLLTIAKVIGLAVLVVAGMLSTGLNEWRPNVHPRGNNLGLALVFVLYAYGGWNHAAYVAAEVRDERRNLPRAILFGLASIAVIYLAVNASYLVALGFGGAQLSKIPAADVFELVFGERGAKAMSLLVMCSALSAINGMILTGAQLFAAWGADFSALASLGSRGRRTGAPLTAIFVQAVIAIALILLVGTAAGRGAFDSMLTSVRIAALPWDRFAGGFETLVAASTPVFWAFTLLTIAAVFVLRSREPSTERPFRIPLFPLPPIVFAGTCLFMLWASVSYARWLTLLGLVPVVVGGLVWLFVGKSRKV
jgi:basic amino acid/polyamine antiporter, APA family